jgi:ATP-binding cassette, subfamily B, bacterial
MEQTISPVARLWNIVREEKSDITAIYFYAILSGLIQLSLPLALQAIIGFVMGGTMRASLIVLISILVGSVLLAGILQMNQMKIIEKIQQRIFVKTAFAFADRIPKLDLKKIDTFYLPELVNRFFDTVSLQKSISKLLLDLPIAVIQIVFGLMLLSFYHPFFILFGLLLVFLLWLILYTTGNKGFESSLEESKYKYALVGWLEEMARLVKSFKFAYASGLHIKKADEKTINYIKARTTHFNVLLFQYKSLVAFKVAITAALMIVGVILLLNQQLNIGQFIAAEIIIITVINSVEKIIVSLENVYDALTSVEKLAKLTNKPVETSGSYVLPASAGITIEAQGLTFGYYADRPVLKDVWFKVTSGQKVCITGNDGSGKSSLLKIFTGAYKDFAGALLINNIPIANYNLLSLREQTGLLFPNEDIFHGTLWENISMGKTNINVEHVDYLCSKTGLHTFLASLPDGFDTELDPTGKRLPRNVVQKILLVRALAGKPSLLLLEEPWQGIEEQYRQGIQQLLLQLEHTTVIIATNDLSFAVNCNQSIHLKS